MKFAAMQPYFFPYLGYFQLIAAVDTYLLYDNVAYQKQCWMNRNRIQNPNQPPFYISLPVRSDSEKMIKETDILCDTRQKEKFLRSLAACYRNSPFFDESYSLFEDAFFVTAKTLGTFNIHSLMCVCRHLDIDTKILTDSSPFQGIENELAALYPGEHCGAANALPKSVKRVLMLCEAFACTHYINAIGGQTLYSREVFAKHGITLQFINTLPYAYPQRRAGFEPGLSIIDVLMNCGKSHTKELLHHYTLI